MRLRLFPAALAVAIALTASVAGAALTWMPFSAPTDGFATRFPGKPEVAEAPSTATVEGIYRTYSVDLGSSAYFVSVFHYRPDGIPSANDATYRGLLDAYAGGSKCKLASTHDRIVAGAAALEGICIEATAKIDHVIDVFLNGDRLYFVVAAGRQGFAKSSVPTRFRDAFSLLPVATPAPAQPSASPVPLPST